ncbi:MAG: hypothetical protein RBS56_02230 [Candidatus Gracilibacteria bacterium]|jgi:hypothetical protein|nr:hypothetical protein [Candidatus Gracilibacteria bacterium]
MKKISKQAISIKSEWLLEDQTFFNTYRKDKKAMQVINALAEMIARFDSQPREQLFSC